MRSDRLRLLDTIDQIDLIRRFSAGGREVFFGDILTQSAVLHRLALLGEACAGLSPQLREAHPEVPWSQIIAFRNVVIHEYFAIDLDLVWAIITEHAASLRASFASIANSLPG